MKLIIKSCFRRQELCNSNIPPENQLPPHQKTILHVLYCLRFFLPAVSFRGKQPLTTIRAFAQITWSRSLGSYPSSPQRTKLGQEHKNRFVRYQPNMAPVRLGPKLPFAQFLVGVHTPGHQPWVHNGFLIPDGHCFSCWLESLFVEIFISLEIRSPKLILDTAFYGRQESGMNSQLWCTKNVRSARLCALFLFVPFEFLSHLWSPEREREREREKQLQETHTMFQASVQNVLVAACAAFCSVLNETKWKMKKVIGRRSNAINMKLWRIIRRGVYHANIWWISLEPDTAQVSNA